MWCYLSNRCVLEVSGPDAVTFLQGLITQDLRKLESARALYGLLLSPQGRFLHDFLMTQSGGALYLECEKDRVQDLVTTLMRFRLRAKVEARVTDRLIYAAWGKKAPQEPTGALVMYEDPRHKSLGWRAHAHDRLDDASDWQTYNAHRLALCIPEGSLDMEVGRAIPAEYNITALGGVDFQKGCYLGQELTARVHHTGHVRKGLVALTFEGNAPLDTTPLFAGEEEIGHTLSAQGSLALGRVRLDALEAHPFLMCAGKKVTFHQLG